MANLAIPALLGLASYMTRNKQQPDQATPNRTDMSQVIGANQDSEDMERGQGMNTSAAQPAAQAMNADQNQSQAETTRLMGQDQNATGTPVAPSVMTQKNPSFKQAFAAARLAGDKTFTWNGKPYTTEMAGTTSTKVTPTVNPADAEAGASRGRRGSATPTTTESKELPADDDFTKSTQYTLYPPEVRAKYRKEHGLAPEAPAKRNPRTGKEMAKGGKVKKFAKGGSVSSRGDGIAKKGYTKGRMI